MELLWEIKRLRSIAMRANQLQITLGPHHIGSIGLILGALREQLQGEPVIEEETKPE